MVLSVLQTALVPITNFVVSGILKVFLQAAIRVFRDGKYRPPRCVSYKCYQWYAAASRRHSNPHNKSCVQKTVSFMDELQRLLATIFMTRTKLHLCPMTTLTVCALNIYRRGSTWSNTDGNTRCQDIAFPRPDAVSPSRRRPVQRATVPDL